MSTKRVRSRAYVITLITNGRLDVENLRRWLIENGSCWLLAHRHPGVEAYVRFASTVSMSRVVPTIVGACVTPSTASFKRVLSEYRASSGITKLEMKEMARVKVSSSPKQAELDEVLSSKGKNGVIGWLNYTTLDDRYLDIVRDLMARTDVLISNESQTSVYELIRDELISRKRSVKGIILFPGEKTALDHEYLQFLSELRCGHLLNSRFVQTQFRPLNVVVITRKIVKSLGDPLPIEIREIYI